MIGRTPVFLNPSSISSFRLYSESPRAKSVISANSLSSFLPFLRRRNNVSLIPLKYSGGVMLWYIITFLSGRDFTNEDTSDPLEKWYIRIFSEELTFLYSVHDFADWPSFEWIY